MKFKYSAVVGAVLAVGSASTFAATAAVVCPTYKAGMTNQENLDYVNKCTPESVLFIGGASTMKGNIFAGVVMNDIFDTSKMAPIPVKDSGSVSGKAGNVLAFYGIGKASGKRVFVVYNFNNGSAAGVSQLLGKPAADSVTAEKTAMKESDVVYVGLDPKAKTANTCTPASTVAADLAATTNTTVTCTTHAPQQADIALSDVAPRELYKLYPSATGKLSTLKGTPLFLQSFGVVVSPKLWDALAKKNIADGLLASSCFVEATANPVAAAYYKTTADCQPSISSADYASLVTKAGSIKSLAALTGDATLTDKLVLARRDDLSGTQASSNIFFANLRCGADTGVKADVKGVPTFTSKVDLAIEAAGGNVSGLPIISSTDTYAGLTILAANVSPDVKNAVADPAKYAIGVLNVGSGGTVANSDTDVKALGRFVKLDGVSPNFPVGAGASTSADSRKNLAAGLYPFAMTTYAVTTTAAVDAKAKDTVKKAMLDTLVTGLQSSTKQAALSGIAYFDGSTTDAGKAVQSAVVRPNGNNCSPLIKPAS
jgi:hypothetical protein